MSKVISDGRRYTYREVVEYKGEKKRITGTSAQGRMEALRMVEKIVKDKYQETGGFDVTAWFPEEYFTDSEGA